MTEERRAHRREGITADENREKQREYCRRYRATEKGLQARRRWSAERPRDYWKQSAQRKVQRAIRDGRLIRLSCICGNPKSEGHHYLGYAHEHWLDVVWLCRLHHAAAHRLLAERAAA